MTVYWEKARKAWRYDFYRERKRHTGYCIDPVTNQPARTKREARDAEAAVRKVLGKPGQGEAGAPIAGVYTFAEAAADWARHVGRHQRSWTSVKGRVAELVQWFGADRALVSIDESLIADYVAWARQQKVRRYQGGPRKLATMGKRVAWRDTGRTRSPATVNRYLATLSTVLRRAHDRRDPVNRSRLLPELPRVRELEEPEAAPNPIPPEHTRAILAAAAPHLFDAIVLAIHLGPRLNEILRLDVTMPDFENRVVRLDSRSKGKRADLLYMNEVAFQVLRRLHDRALSADQTHLLLYDPPAAEGEPPRPPRPVKSLRTAWAGALRRAGLDGRYSFHDLRANFATELARLGVNFRMVKDLARHRDLRTTLRYIKAADVEMADAVARLEGWHGTDVTRPAAGEIHTPKSHTVPRKARGK